MKKILTIAALACVVLTGCSDKKTEQELQRQQALNEATREELQQAVTDRDELLGLVEEISSGMNEIKQLENVLVVNGSSETPSKREQLINDITAIQQTLQQRRQRLEELEKKLARSTTSNAQLTATIASLRSQIDSQTAEIASLKSNLDEAKTQIGLLDAQVDELNTTVTTITAAKDSTERAATNLANELNRCYYAIGNKSELKDNRIIETGFLRKTKLMEGDFDQNFFTVADKRTLTTIDLNSNKAEVLTNQPESSYTIAEVNGHKVLQITNPALFWSRTNYLVVKID